MTYILRYLVNRKISNVKTWLVTKGIAVISMTEHTDAGIPVKSEENPAKMQPIIPPTSNHIEKFAAS